MVNSTEGWVPLDLQLFVQKEIQKKERKKKNTHTSTKETFPLFTFSPVQLIKKERKKERKNPSNFTENGNNSTRNQ